MKKHILLIGLLAAASSSECFAGSAAWTGTTNGNWNVNSNWNPTTGYPMTGYTATFNATVANSTISMNGTAINPTLITFTTNAGNYTFNAGGGSLTTGSITINATVTQPVTETFALNVNVGTNANIQNSSTTAILDLAGGINNTLGTTAIYYFNNVAPANGTINLGNVTSTGGGAVNVTVRGGGLVIMSGTNNSTTGCTLNIQGGELRMNTTGALWGSAGNMAITAGIIGLAAGDFTAAITTAGAGGMRWGTAAGDTGFAAYGADRIVNFSGTGNLTWDALNMIHTGQALILGSATSTNKVNFQTGLALAGAVRTILVNDGISSTNVDGEISGVISGNATSGINKTGSGTLSLSANNTYGGKTIVQNGTLSFSAGNTTATANQQLGANAALDLGVASTSNGTLLYTGGADTLAKDINILGNGGDTIQNSGNGTLNLTGTLTKNGTVLNLKGGSYGINVMGTITGSNSGSDLVVNGGNVTLSAANSYVGPTLVNSGATLALGINNAIPSGSAVTLGDTTTHGTLDMGTYTDAITSLAFGSANGTLKMVANQTGRAQLAASGTVALGTTNTLDLTGMSTSVGVYKLVSGSSLNGTFITVTGMDGNYTLKYGTLTSNELDAQHKATISFALGSNPTNVHVGIQTVNLSIGNTAFTGSADLNYTLGGVTGSGTRVAGNGSSTGTGTYTATAGVNSFSITASDSNATNSPQSVAFTQTGYNLAAANSTQTVNVGNMHVGGTKTASVTLANTAAAGNYTETLSSGVFSNTTTNFTTAGSVSGIAGGGSGSGNLTVGLGGGLSAGAASGTTTLALNSNEVNSSGLGSTIISAQTITITGGVYNLAAANSTQTVNVGNMHVGGTKTASLTLSNTAPTNATYTETLSSGAFSATSTNFTTSGAASGIAGGASGSGNLTVGLGSGLSAGAANGTTTLALNSNAVNGSGLGSTVLSAQTITITGGVYNLAAANTITTPVTLGNVRVGGTFGTSAVSLTNTAPTAGGYTEKLDASFTGTTGNATNNGGTVSLLAAQGTDSTSLVVGLGGNANTATAGAKTGTTTIGLTSNGTGTSGLAGTALAAQTITVNGSVFNEAAANTLGNVTLSNVHVGGTFGTTALTITNTAAAGNYTEGLNATQGATTGSATVAGSNISNLAGGSSSTAISVGLGGNATTGTAGAKTGTATIGFASSGTNSGLGELALGNQTVTVNGGVYNLAAANSTQTVNVGNMHVSGTKTVSVTLSNTASANATYTETLASNGFSGTSANFSATGSASGIAGGSSGSGNLTVGLGSGLSAGTASGTTTLALNSNEVNSSGLGTTVLSAQTITITGQVYSGQGVWNTNGGGSYGTLANMSNWTVLGGAPGLDSNFASSDTATFGSALTVGNATVNLNGAAPSLAGITFNDAAGSYTLSNGSVTLNNGGSAATLTTSNGSHAISADVILASNLAASVSANATLAVSGVISGANKTLNKTGAGTLALSGNNTYSGATTVTGGKLVVNGSLASSSLTVDSNTTLGGTGTIAGDTTIAGTHSPGNSPGIQNFGGNLTYSDGSAMNWELAANTNINAVNPNAIFDTVVVAGNLSFGGITDLNLSFKPVGCNVIWSDPFWQTSRTGTSGWLIYDVAGTINGFSNLNLVAANNWLDSVGKSFDAVLIGSSFSLYQNGHSIFLDYTASTVTTPEPSSGVAMAVFAVLGGAAFLVRRSSRQATGIL